ncbi:MAG: chain-length determining protein [Desulfuromonadales bacterium]|nr:chain-length determining protein [Desulfuromonadales bacterium]
MENEFDYKKYLSLINNHKRLFAFTALVIMTAAVVVSYLLPKKYEARSTVFVSRNVLNDLVRGIAVTPTVEDTLKGLDSTIKSRKIITKVIDELDLNLKKQSDATLDGTIQSLRARTNLQLNEKEGLITISFTDKNPRITRDYVNAVVRRFIEDNLSVKREESYGAISFLSEQAASIKEKLDKTEAEISRVQSSSGAALSADPGAMHAEINAGQQRLEELSLRRSQLEATRNQLRRVDPSRDRINALQKKLEELRVEYTDNYPEVVKTKADIEAAQKEISKRPAGASAVIHDSQELERVEAELRAVRSGEENQRAHLSNSRGLMHANPGARAELEKLERERNSYRGMYDQMMARQGQAEVSKQMEVQDKTTTFRITEPATLPVAPISPNRVRIMLMGIAGGLAGGLGLLMGIDYFDKSVKSVAALKALGIQAVAVIPKIIDPLEIEKERRSDLKLYMAAGLYFSMIVTVLALESLGRSPVEMFIRMINQ